MHVIIGFPTPSKELQQEEAISTNVLLLTS
jgi:hypothetical protein